MHGGLGEPDGARDRFACMGPLDPVEKQDTDESNLLRFPPGYAHITFSNNERFEKVYAARIRSHDGNFIDLKPCDGTIEQAKILVNCAYSAMHTMLYYEDLYDSEYDEVGWFHEQLEEAIVDRCASYNEHPAGISLIHESRPGIFAISKSVPKFMFFPAFSSESAVGQQYLIVYRDRDRFRSWGGACSSLDLCLNRIRYWQVRAAFLLEWINIRPAENSWRPWFEPPAPPYIQKPDLERAVIA